MAINEDTLEQHTLAWFQDLEYETACGYDIAAEGKNPERENYDSVLLENRLQAALTTINPN